MTLSKLHRGAVFSNRKCFIPHSLFRKHHPSWVQLSVVPFHSLGTVFDTLKTCFCQCFFLGVKHKNGRESHFFQYFWFFSRAKIVFHAHFSPFFLVFSRPLLMFTPVFFLFFHGQKSAITFLTYRYLQFYTGILSIYFHG